MAARGFAAAQIDYDNSMESLVCTRIYEGVEAVRASWASKSKEVVPRALDVLCNLEFAACDVGVATTGHSQGGAIAYLSPQYDSRVTGVLGQSFGLGDDECKGNTPSLESYRTARISAALPEESRLLIVGTADTGSPVQREEPCWKGITGASAARTDIGPGFMYVPEGPHSFHQMNPSAEEGERMKCIYRSGSASWALPATFDWLANVSAPTKFVGNATAPVDVSYRHACIDEPIDEQIKGGIRMILGELLVPCVVWPAVGILLCVALCCCGACRRYRCCCFRKRRASPPAGRAVSSPARAAQLDGHGQDVE